MPWIFEKKERPSAHQASEHKRLSGIPRPMKHPAIDKRSTGISHASKPTTDTLLTVPSVEEVKTISQAHLQPISNARQNKNDQDVSRAHKLLKIITKMDNDPEITILELVPFSRQPTVDFGNVTLGATRIRCIILRNIADKQQQMKVVTFPKADRGFYIDATEFLIAPRTEIGVDLAWTPKVLGSIRESITLTDINRMRWRIVLSGTGVAPQLPFQPRTGRPLVPRLSRKPSPSKIYRHMISNHNKLVFSPLARQSASTHRRRVAEALIKLRTPSPSKRSQIVRKILSRRDNEIITKIQSYCRMCLVKRGVEKRKRLITMLQARIRGFLVRRHLEKERKAVTVIQSHWRGHKARQMASELRKSLKAVIWIQSRARGLLARRELERKRVAVIKIQSHWRAYMARQELNRLRRFHQSIISFQSQARGLLIRKLIERERAAATIIQSCWRAYKARKQLELLRRVNQSVILLQSQIRGYLARRHLSRQHLAATVIQSHWRAYKARQEFQKLKDFHRSVVWMQAQIRGFLVRKDLERRQAAAIKLQSHWRAYKARAKLKALKRFLQSVIWLQSRARATLVRRELARKQFAATVIQSHWRAFKARQELRRLRRFVQSIIWLQSQSRGYQVRRQLKRSVEAIFSIQLQSFRRSLVISGQNQVTRSQILRS